jgi:hypothetical protein
LRLPDWATYKLAQFSSERKASIHEDTSGHVWTAAKQVAQES